MPFKSKAQKKYLYATNPKLAKKFQKKTPKGTKLPNNVNNRSYRRKAKGGTKKKVQRYKRK